MATQLVKPPLSAADKRNCDACLHTLHELLHEIDKAEQVGVDTTEARQRYEHYRQRLMQYKQTYFPGEP